jgi:arsenite-transporting ATPase
VVPVLTVPYLEHEPAGAGALPALEALGAHLQDPVELLDPVGPRAVGGAPVISRQGEEFELALSLPFARREELDLHRLGDDLVIRLGRDRRVLTLRSGLRRCRVIGARLDGAALRVRFEPDPALWRS